MITIRLLLNDNEQLTVADIVELMSRQFSGTVVTAQNSFEAERKRAVDTIAEIAEKEHPLKNPQLILDSIANKEVSMGPGVDIMVPLDSSTVLEGYIWRKQAMLSTNQDISDSQLNLLHCFFTSLKVGTIFVAKSN